MFKKIRNQRNRTAKNIESVIEANQSIPELTELKGIK